MINDILEQTAEDYFRNLGYFTQHNVKYRPNDRSPQNNVNSDVDLVGVHPTKSGVDKVIVVSCKSWHGGMRIKSNLEKIKNDHVKTKKIFREVAMPTWSVALKQNIKKLTGQSNFIFYIACIKYSGKDKHLWENNPYFKRNLKGCPIKLLDFSTMINEVWDKLKGITPSNSELERILQFIKFSKGKIVYEIEQRRNNQ